MTFFADALSYVADSDFDEVLSAVFARLYARGPSPVVDDVIEHASLQFPELLRRHMRGCDDSLLAGIEAFRDVELAVDAGAAACGSAPFHVIFPRAYIREPDAPLWLCEKPHPTWGSEDADMDVGIGGEASGSCPSCDGPLHRLIQFGRSRGSFGAELPWPIPITVATCFSCLGWEEWRLYFKHDQAGEPVGLNVRSRKARPQFPAGPLRSCRARLVRLSPRWATQDWGASNGRQNLHRVGGAPTWIQQSDQPDCAECRSPMVFAAQFDSYLPLEGGGEWLWGSGGIGYVFWCGRCRVTCQFWQCT